MQQKSTHVQNCTTESVFQGELIDVSPSSEPLWQSNSEIRLSESRPSARGNQPTSQQRQKDFLQERMRQAKWSYNLAVLFLAASSIPFLMGITLMAVGQINSGATSTAGGVGSSLLCSRWLKVAREANDRLDRSSQ